MKVSLSKLKGKSYEKGKKILEESGYRESDYADSTDSTISDYVCDSYFSLYDDEDNFIDGKIYTEYYNLKNYVYGDQPETVTVKKGWNDWENN